MRLLRRLLILLLVLAGIAAAIWLASRPSPTAVTTATVDRGTVEAIVANTRAGTIKAHRRARLAPAVGGQVADLPVEEGDNVTKGQILLQLWNDDLRAELQLAQAEATAAQARADSACKEAELAQRDAERQRSLHEGELAAEEAYDRAVTAAKTAEAACRAARAQVDVESARITSVQAKLELTILRAPFAGVVAEVTPEVGEFVTPSPPGIPTPPAIDLVDKGSVYVLAPIDEVDAPRVEVGMPVRVTLDAFPGQTLAGHVRRIAPYVLDVEKQARTVDVEVALEGDAAARLLPGYSADVEIVVATHDNVLRVPTAAVREGNVVLRVGDDHVVHSQHLEVGLSSWQWTEVDSGLQAGDQVVVEADAVLQPGDEVEIRSPEQP